jgi:hypothetical protein
MILVGPPGGAPGPGDTPHPWTSKSTGWLTTCDDRGRALRGATAPASVARRATRGARAPVCDRVRRHGVVPQKRPHRPPRPTPAERSPCTQASHAEGGAPPPPGCCLINCPRLRPLTAARGARSALTGASAGPITGATCHTSASEPRSAAKQSLLASGRSPAARSHAAGSSHAIGVSKRPLVNAHATGAGDPCLRTIVSPTSPTGHLAGYFCVDLF